MDVGRKATLRWDSWTPWLCAAAVFWGLAAPCEAAKNEKEEEKAETPRYAVVGRDPQAFADAESMLAESKLPLLEDGEAVARLLDLEQSVAEHGLWSTPVWESLERLRGVRMASPRIAELSVIARSATSPQRKPSRSAVKAAFNELRQGNAHYAEGRLDSAVQSYRSALTRHPKLWDAWNNMALAELHGDNNLVAVFGFASLTANAPSYVGAAINLAVALERLELSDLAYQTAGRIVEENPDVAMARYNKAWFESARGDYEAARGELAKVMEAVDAYAPAERLQAINELEAGRSIDGEGMKALGVNNPHEESPRMPARRVGVLVATAYAGEEAVAELPRDTSILVSEEAGDWVAFYLPMRAGKRRLWLNKGDLVEGEVVTGSPVEGEAVTGGRPEPAAAPEVTAEMGESARRFVGTWGEKWGDIRKTASIRIAVVDGRPKVTMAGWKVWDEKIDEDGRLVYRKKGGHSGWEFVYTVTATPQGMSLEVFRVHDRKRFNGRLTN